MRNLEWVAPVIFVIVVIVNAILKGREEAESKSEDRSTKPRGNVELDRFLAEIDRLRREKAGQPPPIPATAPPPPVARPVISIEQRPVPHSRLAAPQGSEALPSRTPGVGKTVASIATTRQSRTVHAALSLLRRPQTIASAVILQEVLGPPKCKRRP